MGNTKKIFITGASGNVGSALIRALQKEENFSLGGGWCREEGEDLGTLGGITPLGIKAVSDLEKGLAESGCQVVVDFSSTPVLEENMKIYLTHKVDAVIGTTGLRADQVAPFEEEVARQGLRWAMIPNYGLGINLVSDFIRKARQFYPFVTIKDQHPHTMANAPSGTAAFLAKATSPGPQEEVASRETLPGVLGGSIEGIPVFSQRLPWPGPYSAHEVTLARQDEVITIIVQDHTSQIYMDGVFLTLRKLPSFPQGSFIKDLGTIMNA